VEVQIAGSPRLVRALKPEQVTAFLDLGDKQAGSIRVPLTTGNVLLPLGLDVVKVSPSFIRVDLEGRVRKSLLVRPNFEGKPPPHYTIHSVIIDPPKILVEGPSSMMKGISFLQTEPIQLESMDYSAASDPSYTVELNAGVVFSPASIRSVEGIKKVKVTFNFEAVKNNRPARKPENKTSS
jgi:YbbR domain-containing protein